MSRSWIRKAMIAAVACAVAVCGWAGTAVLAGDDTTLLVGVSADRGPQYIQCIVIKSNVVPYVGPPGGPPVEDPPSKQSSYASMSGKSPVYGTGIDGNLGGGVGLITATPEMRVEQSLKDLARELR